MRPDANPACAIRLTRHFLERLRERFPEWRVTEGGLQRVLEDALWHPAAGRTGFYYAVCRTPTRKVVCVVRLEDRLADLTTVYEPERGWEMRLNGGLALPLSILLAAQSNARGAGA